MAPAAGFDQNFCSAATYDTLRELFAPHVESFNFAMEDGLREAVNNLEPLEVSIASARPAYARASAVPVADENAPLNVWISRVHVQKPYKVGEERDARGT